MNFLKRLIKSLIKWTLSLALLIIIAGLTIQYLIPLDIVKKMASERVKAMTGRDLVISGNVEANFWPNIGVKLHKVTLSNPNGFNDEHLAIIKKLTIEIELMPLLHGELRIKQFVIDRPIINLEINKNNIPNWQFTKQTSNGNNTPSPNTKKTSATILVLGKTKIIDGDISYKNIRTGKSYHAKHVNLDIKIPKIDSTLDMVAKFTLNNERSYVYIHVDQPLHLIEDGESKIKANAKIGSLFAMTFAGKATMKDTSGKFGLNIPSLITLSNWTGKELNWKENASLAVNINGSIACNISDCTLKKTKFKLDDNTIKGDLKINFSSTPTSIEGKLISNGINLNYYLENPTKQIAKSPSQTNNTKKDPTKTSKRGQINFSWLNALNANLSLNADYILFRKTLLEKTSLTLKISNGKLTLNIPHTELYNGTAKISASANTNNVISANISAKNLKANPLIKDFTKLDRLSGIISMNTSISGKGNSQHEIISSLNGKGNIQLNNGMIRGVNIAKIISNARAMITGDDTSSEITKFSKLSGTFTINHGIIKNDDLIIKTPVLRIKGAGTVNIPKNYVNYKLTPSIITKLQGQPTEKKIGINIPVIVKGNFKKLKFIPDLGSAVQETLKNPKKLKDTVKMLKNSVKKPQDIKNLLKNFR